MSRRISDIIIHPDWNNFYIGYDADIAILRLDKPVQFTDYIKPVCFPSTDENVFDINGTVVGYGLTEKSKLKAEKVAKFVEIPSVKQAECLKSDSRFQIIASRRTFCAGLKSKAPCRN